MPGDDDRAELAALARRGLVVSVARALRQDALECLAELRVEDTIDYRVEGRVAVSEPGQDLWGRGFVMMLQIFRYSNLRAGKILLLLKVDFS